ncbi:MAG: carboxypeptidase regulatory-like domain-containing protein [Acidobacteriota bacterium]
MRKLLSVLCVLLLVSPLIMAQQRTGDIYGRVTDTEGNPLPGVTVTLTGARTATMTSITSNQGRFRFVSLSPASDYTIKAELEGFKTSIKENIIVVIGSNVEVNIEMEMGALEEEVTVTAVTPVVDTKKTEVGQNVTKEILQSLPTARDPWVVLQMAPSVLMDRENVGGAESGQQSELASRGAASDNQTVWNMDGMVITDPAAIGGSPSYYDFDAFEEMKVTVGGSDITTQTGGVSINLVTRRGGNKVSLGGRFYMTDEKFQAANEDYVEEVRQDEPGFIGINRVNNIKDYGFNLGVPIWKDHIWAWGSYGVQDIKTTTVYGRADDTMLQNYAFKVNAQIVPENRFEAFMHVGGKNKWGRSSSASLPGGYYQGGRYHFGSPIFKIQDEHMFGNNFFASVQYTFSDAGFNLTPMDDLDFENPVWYDYTNRVYEAPDGDVACDRYYVERPVNQYAARGTLFLDDFLGMSHEWLFGAEYSARRAYTESVYPGNLIAYWNINYPTLNWDFSGNPSVAENPAHIKYFEFWRGYYRDYGVDAYSFYLRDTATFGRFTLNFALRYDQQQPYVAPITVEAVTDNPAWDEIAAADTKAVLDDFLPGAEVDEVRAYDKNGDDYWWKTFSPRIGITYDVTGDGKTTAKLSLAQYGDFMGMIAGSWMPGGTSGWMGFYWDDNGDNVIQLNELYWGTVGDGSYTPYQVFPGGTFGGDLADAGGEWYGGYDPSNPQQLTDPYTTYDPEAQSTRTSEVILTLQREVLPDFGVSINATYRKYDKNNWTKKHFGNFERLQTQDWYVEGPPLPSSVDVSGADTPWDGDMGGADDNPYEYMTNDYQGYDPSAYSPYEYYTQRPDYYNDYWGFDIIFNKRLSNKWMLNGSFTFQTQKVHYGDEGYMSLTNNWALDGRVYSPYQGEASGKISQYTYSPWMLKLSGLYQLPYGINVSMNFQARDGWLLRETVDVYDYRIPNPRSRSRTFYLEEFGNESLPTFYKLDIRLEKVLSVGDVGKIYIMADLFNALNSTIENRRYQYDWGTVYIYPDNSTSFTPDATAGSLNEILNPRLLRFGVRFEF